MTLFFYMLLWKQQEEIYLIIICHHIIIHVCNTSSGVAISVLYIPLASFPGHIHCLTVLVPFSVPVGGGGGQHDDTGKCGLGTRPLYHLLFYGNTPWACGPYSIFPQKNSSTVGGIHLLAMIYLTSVPSCHQECLTWPRSQAMYMCYVWALRVTRLLR